MFIANMIYWIYMILDVLSGLIFVYSILTWIVRPDAPIYKLMYKLVDPFLLLIRPLARRIMKNAMVDLTPFFAIIAIQILKWLISRLYYLF